LDILGVCFARIESSKAYELILSIHIAKADLAFITAPDRAGKTQCGASKRQGRDSEMHRAAKTERAETIGRLALKLQRETSGRFLPP
jgi:hypothetical protein